MNMLARLLSSFALVGGLHLTSAAAPASARPEPRTAAVVQGGEADELVRTALEQLQQQKFDEVLVTAAKAARLNPNDFRPYALTGYAQLSLGSFEAASGSFAKAIRLRPRDEKLHRLKASADLARGAYAEAIAASRKALAINPDYAEAFAVLGEALRWDEKRQAEAIAAYRSAIKADPKMFLAYEQLGELLAKANDEKGAEEVFRQGLALDPERMAGRFALGRMLIKQGRLAEARQIWEGRTSGEDNIFPNLISLLERAEKLKQATDALAQKPDDPEALVQMGFAVMEGDSWVVDGRHERAVVYFEKALKAKPNYARAQYGIAKAYIELADIFDDKKKLADAALAKLRRLDAALARELDEYKKNYSGGLQVVAPPKPAGSKP